MPSFFNAETLAAAKDAGIPISALVGILSIFSIVAFTAGKLKLPALLAVLTFAATSAASLVFVLWFSTREIYQWVDTKVMADWAGFDEGWTDGRIPEPNLCNREREGNIATCWSNRRGGYPTDPPPIFSGTQGTGVWCTYKMRENTDLVKATGPVTGRVFICARVSL